MAEHGDLEASQPSRTATSEIADRPHSWTIGLSIGALVISGVSLVVSWRVHALQRATSSASVQVVSAALLGPRKSSDPPSVQLTVVNFGKATAAQASLKINLMVSERNSFFSFDSLPEEVSLPSRPVGAVASGATATVNQGFSSWDSLKPTKFETAGGYVFVSGTIEYRDTLTDQDLSDEFCFQLEVGPSFKQHAAGRCGRLVQPLRP